MDERCVQKAEDQRLEFKDPNTSAFACLYLLNSFTPMSATESN